VKYASMVAALVIAASAAWADSVPIRTVTANLYEAGVEGARSVGTVKLGTVVEILSEKPGWFKVKTPDGKTAWVRGNAVDTEKRTTGGTTGGTTGTRPPAGGGASAGAPANVAATGESGGEDLWSKMGGGGSTDKAYAAGKGFSEEVEQGYRKNHPNLEPYFEQVDRVLLGMDYNHPQALEQFRRQGYLGEFAGNAPGR